MSTSGKIDAAAPRQPAFNLPAVILGLAALLLAIHAAREYLLGFDTDAWVLQSFSFVPGRFTYGLDPAGLADALVAMRDTGSLGQQQMALFLLGDGQPQWWTLLTYAGLHADWTHVGVNCLWLLAFGTPVARRFGTPRFLLLFVVTAVAGAAAHYATHRFDLAPVVGASAAISGAMAAAARFIFQPGAPLGSSLAFGTAEHAAYRRPALPLRALVTDGKVMPFVAMWFVVNLLVGVAALPLGLSSGQVAWEAHVGGFVAGLLLFPLLDPYRTPPAASVTA